MPDGNRPTIDVELFVGNAQAIAAIDHLDRECLIELPQSDILHGQVVSLKKLRHRENRADAHDVRIASGDGNPPIDTQR